MATAPRNTLWFARWGVLLSALVLGTALCVTSWSNYRGVERASADLVRGQAAALMESLHGYLRALDGMPNAEELDAWVTEQSDEGVRYAALSFETDSWVEGGTRIGPPVTTALAMTQRGVTTTGDRIRIVRQLARRKPRVARWLDRNGLHPRGQPLLIIEFEPAAARALNSTAASGLLTSGAVAVALLIAAGLTFRWLLRQERLERTRARQQHLASLGEMSAVLAHEIRNPLASLKGHAQLLEETLPSGKERDKAGRVVGEAVRLERLTSDLLDFVRTGEIAPVAADPVAVLERAAATVVAGDIEVVVEKRAAPPTWQLDPQRIEQLLVNLLKNAVEASPAGGRVEAAVVAHDGALEYRVRDRGGGITPGDEERIFEPFHTKRARGTGLGLAVVRRIAEAHAGSVRAANHPEGGAVFTVVLPARLVVGGS